MRIRVKLREVTLFKCLSPKKAESLEKYSGSKLEFGRIVTELTCMGIRVAKVVADHESLLTQ